MIGLNPNSSFGVLMGLLGSVGCVVGETVVAFENRKLGPEPLGLTGTSLLSFVFNL